MIYAMALKEVKRSTEDAYTGHGPPPYVGVLFMASAAHEEFKGVNKLLVTLEVGLRIQRYGVVWLLVNTSWYWRLIVKVLAFFGDLDALQ